MVEKQFEPSTVTLQNYGGKIATVEGVIQIQRDTPTSCLIGTDLLPQFGLLFLQTELDGVNTDLLRVKYLRNEGLPSPSSIDGVEYQSKPKSCDILYAVCLIHSNRLAVKHISLKWFGQGHG